MAYLLAVAFGTLLVLGIVALVAWDDVRDRGKDEPRLPDDGDR
ncbi:hypothetical protein ACFWF7_41870 [Nocardia sp. NPDC060256]